MGIPDKGKYFKVHKYIYIISIIITTCTEKQLHWPYNKLNSGGGGGGNAPFSDSQ